MPKKPNPKIGDIVEVAFDDHSEGESIPEFIVYGRVIAKDRTKLVIATWEPKSMESGDPNTVSYTIMRKVIVSIRVARFEQDDTMQSATQL